MKINVTWPDGRPLEEGPKIMAPKTSSLYAYVSTCPVEKRDHIIMMKDQAGTPYPLIDSELERIQAYGGLVQNFCDAAGKSARLVRFEQMEVIEELRP